jgi:hypothetical protein
MANEISSQGKVLLAELENWTIHEPQAELPDNVQDYPVFEPALSTQYLCRNGRSRDPGNKGRAALIRAQRAMDWIEDGFQPHAGR